jgi:hypothetical protein
MVVDIKNVGGSERGNGSIKLKFPAPPAWVETERLDLMGEGPDKSMRLNLRVAAGDF